MTGIGAAWARFSCVPARLSRLSLSALALVVVVGAAAPAAQAAPAASVVLGDPDQENGLSRADEGDGRTTPVTVAGMSGRATAPGDNPAWGRYMYFRLDDRLALDGYYVARIDVTYLDEGTSRFELQYDSNDCAAPVNGAYKSGPSVTKTGTGGWKTATLEVPDARFANRENGGSDFRLSAGAGLTVHSVTLTIVQDRTPKPPVPDAGVAQPVKRVTLERSASRLALDNGYVRAEVDLQHPQVDAIRADFGGRRRYAADLTAAGAGPLGQSGIVLERDDANGTHASSEGAGPDLRVRVLRDTPQEAVVEVSGIVDDFRAPLATSTWTLSLGAEQRAFRLRTSTRALRDGDVRGIRISSYLSPSSIQGFFDPGAVQMLGSPQSYFASGRPLERVYALGAPGGGTLDMTASGQRETVLRSTASCGNPPDAGAFRTGLEQVLAGSYPSKDRWDGAGWQAAAPQHVTAGSRWRTDATVAANGHDFPAGTLRRPKPNLPVADLRAIYTAVYGTAAGVLDSYALPGEAAPTLATPGRHYGDGRNFYDPDTWMLVSALVYSGDPYLQQQARTLVEKSGDAISASGQIPHHFEGANPTFVAISGATQTGPNIFWIAAALQYVKATGDYDWLRAHRAQIERALTFLTDRYDPGLQLVSAPGPLWIDVFIRENYASDTNAYMIDILREAADGEQFLGDAELATRRRALADDIVEGMNLHLWAGDHYITQLNPDGSTRDLVDYDSNLLAVAFGVAPPERAQQILARVDAGPCTHGRATWVSERFYGPADTYGGNTGDSATTMGRIAWADAHARARVGDHATYEQKILDPIRSDLLARTWLTERYDCAGNPIRTPYYHEYPELVVMLLRELTYGIQLGLGTVTIDPFGPSAFQYHVGDVDVGYSAQALDLRLPGSGDRQFDVHGLTPGASYTVIADGDAGGESPQRVRADGDGVLRFTARVGPATTVSVRRQD
jgi:hypothetical protein